LATALAVFIHSLFLQSYLVVYLLTSLGYKVKILRALRFSLLSLLGKYIPGKIWIATMRSTFFASEGVPVKTVLTSSVLETVYMVFTAVALYLISNKHLAGSLFLLQITFGVLIILILAFVPGLVLSVLNMFFRRLGKEEIHHSFSTANSMILSGLYICNWTLQGLGVWILANGMSAGLPPSALLMVTGAFAISVMAGFITLFAPGGLGVREGMLALLLSSHIPIIKAAFIALAVRLAVSLAEILALAILYLIQFVKKQLRASMDLME